MAPKCKQRQRVWSKKLHKKVWRCKRFKGKSSYRRRKPSVRRRGRKRTYRKRKPSGMAIRGSKCKTRQRVYSRKLRKRVWRCKTFTRPRRRRAA